MKRWWHKQEDHVTEYSFLCLSESENYSSSSIASNSGIRTFSIHKESGKFQLGLNIIEYTPSK